MAEMIWQSIEPSRRELTFGFYMPADWRRLPIPEEAPPDFSDPRAMMPLAAFMATYAPIVLAVGARPAFDDGTPAQWLAFLADRPEHAIDGPPTPLRLGNVNAVTVTGRQAGDEGMAMRMRMALVHAGGAIVAISVIAPTPLWDGMVKTLDEMLASFSMALVKHPPLEQEAAQAKAEEAPAPALTEAAEPVEEALEEEVPPPTDAPTRAADVRLAEDAGSFDPGHKMNVYFRDNGIGLVPRLLELNEEGKFGLFGCGAVVATLRVPFGWHVIDDGKRTLVFDAGGDIQVNLNLFDAGGMTPDHAADATVDELSRELVGFEHVRLELMGLPCVGVKYVDENGTPLEQGYLFKPYPHSPNLLLKVRATATPEKIVLAMNLAEVLLRDLQFAPSERPPEHAPAESPRDEPAPKDTTIRAKGDPEWWTRALEFEAADKLKEAEQVITKAVEQLGGPPAAVVADLYKHRSHRLAAAGKDAEAEEAVREAVKWIDWYASTATSGGEGAARSREAADFRKGLGM